MLGTPPQLEQEPEKSTWTTFSLLLEAQSYES